MRVTLFTTRSYAARSAHADRDRPLMGRGIASMALLLFCLYASTVRAEEEPEIAVGVSASEIFLGETVDYQVEIRNVKNPSAPDMSAIKQKFDVTPNGDRSRNQSSTFIINGRVSEQSSFSHIFQYRLTPKSTGTLLIPPAKATINGETITSETVPLRVVEVEPQDVVVVEIEPSQTTVYPTQPFTIKLRLFVKPLARETDRDPLSPLRRQPPHLQINWVDPIAGLTTEDKGHWLQPLLSDDSVGFTINDLTSRSNSIFDGMRAAVFNLMKGRETRDDLNGKPVRYFAYELSRTFTPEKTGSYTFGPAIVKGTFAAGFERGEYTAKKLVASSTATTVEVRDVPTPRPATYCGGIGDYRIVGSASPSKLRVGDPLTITLDFERGADSGSLQLVSAPDLSANEQLSADFELIDKNPTGRIDGSTKRFAYALRPKRPGVSIPAITVSTFNPQTEQFDQVQTKPILLEVSEASQITSGDLIGGRSSSSPTTTIKSRTEGIFQNITDPAELHDDRIDLLSWTEISVGVWIAAGLIMGLVTLYRHKSSDPVWMRRQQARKIAYRRLSEARSANSQGQPKEALRLVRSSLIGLIADLQNRIAEGLTTTDVDGLLKKYSLGDADRTTTLNLLESIESGEYGAGQSIDPATAIETAASLIPKIATRLERGPKA